MAPFVDASVIVVEPAPPFDIKSNPVIATVAKPLTTWGLSVLELRVSEQFFAVPSFWIVSGAVATLE